MEHEGLTDNWLRATDIVPSVSDVLALNVHTSDPTIADSSQHSPTRTSKLLTARNVHHLRPYNC